MKILKFKIRYRNPAGDFDSNVTVRALNENVGMRRALDIFTRDLPTSWVVLEVISLNTQYSWGY